MLRFGKGKSCGIAFPLLRSCEREYPLRIRKTLVWKHLGNQGMEQVNVDAVVLGTVNASLPETIDADTLVRVLEGKIPGDPYIPALDIFFSEVSGRVLGAFLDKHGIDFEVALKVARQYVKDRFPALLPVERLAHVG